MIDESEVVGVEEKNAFQHRNNTNNSLLLIDKARDTDKKAKTLECTRLSNTRPNHVSTGESTETSPGFQ